MSGRGGRGIDRADRPCPESTIVSLNTNRSAKRPAARIVEREPLRWAYTALGGIPALVIGALSSRVLFDVIRGVTSGPDDRLHYAFQASLAVAAIWSLAGGLGTLAGWYVIWGRVPRSRRMLRMLVGLIAAGLTAAFGLVLLGGRVAVVAALTLAVGSALLVHLLGVRHGYPPSERQGF